MIWTLFLLAFVIIAIIGFVMVNKVGNYETIWGLMLWWGIGAVAGMIIVKVSMLISAGIFMLF